MTIYTIQKLTIKFFENSKKSSKIQKNERRCEANVKVAVRVRPLSFKEVGEGVKCCSQSVERKYVFLPSERMTCDNAFSEPISIAPRIIVSIYTYIS